MRRVKEKNLRFFKLTALTIILAVLCTCSAASAYNLRVSSTEEGDYISIQAAIDQAEAGDTIFVGPGTYIENIKINKEVKLWSDSRKPEDTIIRAVDPMESTVEISVDRASFSGFGIEGSEKTGILLTGVKSCYINNNRIQGAESGILLNNSESNIISNNLITLNEKGIRLESSNSNDVQSNLIAYNYGPGISLEASSRNLIYNNYIKNAENIEENAENANNTWHSTLTVRQNIIRGPYVAGNFWSNPEGKGYSDTGVDENSNGICDTSYNITGGGTDKSPLFPKVPNAVKALESSLDASAYKQGLVDRENTTSPETSVNETEVSAEQEAENTTDKEVSGETKSPGLRAGIAGVAMGAAYFLRRNR